jgi:hypothetical protein
MFQKGLSLLEVLVIVIVIGILAALLLPVYEGGGCHLPKTSICSKNLSQLYKIGTAYAASHRGQWPDPQKANYWVAFTKTSPPLIEPEGLSILSCPAREEQLPDECDYRGPIVPWNKLSPSDPIAADRPGNHEGRGINVLFKDGSVMEVELDDPRWKRWNELLGP